MFCQKKGRPTNITDMDCGDPEGKVFWDLELFHLQNIADHLAAGIDPRRRAETLSIAELGALTDALCVEQGDRPGNGNVRKDMLY